MLVVGTDLGPNYARQPTKFPPLLVASHWPPHTSLLWQPFLSAFAPASLLCLAQGPQRIGRAAEAIPRSTIAPTIAPQGP